MHLLSVLKVREGEETGRKVTFNDMLHYVYEANYSDLTLSEHRGIIPRAAGDFQPCPRKRCELGGKLQVVISKHTRTSLKHCSESLKCRGRAVESHLGNHLCPKMSPVDFHVENGQGEMNVERTGQP